MPHGLYRVKSSRHPWNERTALSGHLYPPRTRYWEDTRGIEGRRHSAWFMFSSGEQAGLTGLIDRNAGFARFLDPEGTLGRLIAAGAAIGQERGEEGFWEVQGLLCRTFSLLLGSVPVEGPSRRIRSEIVPTVSDFTAAIDEILGRHLDGRLSLAALAGAMHISPSALSHRYRRETGRPPMQAMQAMRIDRARALLLRGFRLKAVADELGFSDAFHLSRTFKRVTGMAPREYLASVKQ